ncbi:MAG TPA: hypothetical protein VH601_24940 [Bryobacteraceae bacterium]|jgi:hypothetical protein
MSLRNNTLLSALFLFWLSSTCGNAESLALQSTPTIDVFVYAFPGFSSWILEGAETEAARVLRPARIELHWMHCSSEAAPASCHSPLASHELVVRFTPSALAAADKTSLGAAFTSAGVAFVFCDRVRDLQTSGSLFHMMLGRVLAHEITHLLLPGVQHSEVGLMRAHWVQDDLRFVSTACLGLTPRSVQLMQQEARRREIAPR